MITTWRQGRTLPKLSYTFPSPFPMQEHLQWLLLCRGTTTCENVDRLGKVVSGECKTVCAELLSGKFICKKFICVYVYIYIYKNPHTQTEYIVSLHCKKNYTCLILCISATFWWICGIFRGSSKFLFVKSTIFRGAPGSVLQNPSEEQLHWVKTWNFDNLNLILPKI
jgi:hypothetical protein